MESEVKDQGDKKGGGNTSTGTGWQYYTVTR